MGDNFSLSLVNYILSLVNDAQLVNSNSRNRACLFFATFSNHSRTPHVAHRPICFDKVCITTKLAKYLLKIKHMNLLYNGCRA